jgi:hypothetical protein
VKKMTRGPKNLLPELLHINRKATDGCGPEFDLEFDHAFDLELDLEFDLELVFLESGCGLELDLELDLESDLEWDAVLDRGLEIDQMLAELGRTLAGCMHALGLAY